MIVDSIQNAKKYFALHPLFEKAFQYLKENDLSALEVGKSDISEGLKMIVSDGPGKTAEASLAKFECHNENIDILSHIENND
jgi:YhcH/YjgK/YiaL family protein